MIPRYTPRILPIIAAIFLWNATPADALTCSQYSYEGMFLALHDVTTGGKSTTYPKTLPHFFYAYNRLSRGKTIVLTTPKHIHKHFALKQKYVPPTKQKAWLLQQGRRTIVSSCDPQPIHTTPIWPGLYEATTPNKPAPLPQGPPAITIHSLKISAQRKTLVLRYTYKKKVYLATYTIQCHFFPIETERFSCAKQHRSRHLPKPKPPPRNERPVLR
jgi:hypothetical protein